MSTDLASRYGGRRTSRLPIALAVIIALAFLAWLAWAIRGQSDPEVTSAQVSFKIVDAHHAQVTLQVDLHSADVRATCRLDATAADHTTVGEIDLVVGPGLKGTQTLTRTLRTERTATTVESQGCTAPGQARPR